MVGRGLSSEGASDMHNGERLGWLPLSLGTCPLNVPGVGACVVVGAYWGTDAGLLVRILSIWLPVLGGFMDIWTFLLGKGCIASLRWLRRVAIVAVLGALIYMKPVRSLGMS